MTETTVVPFEHCGKWIAWDFAEMRIIATGETYSETKQAAEQTGEPRPVLVKAPQAEVRFIGGSR